IGRSRRLPPPCRGGYQGPARRSPNSDCRAGIVTSNFRTLAGADVVCHDKGMKPPIWLGLAGLGLTLGFATAAAAPTPPPQEAARPKTAAPAARGRSPPGMHA